ncbi:MAG: hypothetical protein PHI63_00975 [Patescibacteria group bacterium]|nr:hypothetical protein [Patescibacteria group bacterium]
MPKLSSIFSGVRYGRYDKLVHFFASAAIAVIFLPILPLPQAAALSLSFGIAKELYDWLWRHGSFDWYDICADACGVAAATAAYGVMLPIMLRSAG